MEQAKMPRGKKAEAKEETAREHNPEIDQRMEVGREKDNGAGKKAEMIKLSRQHNRHGRGGGGVPLSPDRS
jgi:hypothetical protein